MSASSWVSDCIAPNKKHCDTVANPYLAHDAIARKNLLKQLFLWWRNPGQAQINGCLSAMVGLVLKSLVKQRFF